MTLFVTGLMNDMDDTDLREMFELYGDVKSAKVVMDRNTGKSRGFGFVDMPNDADAITVIGLLNGKKLGGKLMSVQKSDTPTHSR
ncbi:MAG: RNA recognition motif domain-containing protein [Chitinophagaceae bacterium]